MVGKQSRTHAHEPSLCAESPVDLVHSDTIGQNTPTAIDGSKYYGLFIDSATRSTYIALMKPNCSSVPNYGPCLYGHWRQTTLDHALVWSKLFQNATSMSRRSVSHVAKETLPNLVSWSIQMASNSQTVHRNQWLKCHVRVQTNQKVVRTSNSEH